MIVRGAVLLVAVVAPGTALAQSADGIKGDGPVVTLVTTDARARLQSRVDGRWESVCDAPCATQLSPEVEYRVGGHGLRATKPFRLPGEGPLTVDAHVASWARFIAGASTTGLGAPFLLLGAVYLPIGYLTTPTTCNGGPCNQTDDDAWKRTWTTLGGVFLGIGVALVIPGIILLAGSRSTVEVRGNGSAARWTPTAGLMF